MHTVWNYSNALSLSLVTLPRQEERKSLAAKLVSYITAIMRVPNGSDTSNVYRKWARAYESEREVEHCEDTWETPTTRKRWLHWEEVLEAVREQREACEDTSMGLTQAREGVQLAVLLMYCCLPPGRAQEYRTLAY